LMRYFVQTFVCFGGLLRRILEWRNDVVELPATCILTAFRLLDFPEVVHMRSPAPTNFLAG
jgi:hypothetical protein